MEAIHRSSPRNIAVVVVHGVGKTAPGEAVNDIVETLKRDFSTDVAAEPFSAVYKLVGPDGDRFVAYARTVRLVETGQRIRFCDVHWADITSILPGQLSSFLGAFRIVLESHTFVRAMVPADNGLLFRTLRRLLLLACALVRGPIVVLTLLHYRHRACCILRSGLDRPDCYDTRSADT